MAEEQITQDVREKIIEAARELFTQKGFNGTSVRDIAAASETNVAMVNYYFRSKYNLFTDIFNEAFSIVTGKIFTIVESDLSFFDMVRRWIYAYYEVLAQYPGFPLFILNELAQRPEALKERFETGKPNQIFHVISKRLKDEQAQGNVVEMSIQDFGMNLVSLCVFPFAFASVANAILSIEDEDYLKFLESHKVCVADFVINGLRK